MMIENDLVIINESIIVIDLRSSIIMQDTESENFLMKLLFLFHSLKELNNAFDCQCHAVDIMSISNLK